MRGVWMRGVCLPAAAAVLAFAVAGCGDGAPAEPAAPASAPAAIATTNAEVEPAPGASPAPAAAPTPAETPESKSGTAAPLPAQAADDACGADRATRFVGQVALPPKRAELIEAVGHNRIRWIKPGDAVTMDFSESRLNVMLDAGNRIPAVKCG